MASVSAASVRDVLNIADADIHDAKIVKMIKRAEDTLELETSAQIDYLNCTNAQKEAITVLAAINVLCFLTGGSSIGLNFRVGDLRINQGASNLPGLDVLQTEYDLPINALKTPFVGSA